MNPDTKNRILQHGARIVHARGYHATGIQEVLAAAQVPKGSFYFYFPSKKDFGLALIDQYRRHFVESAERMLADRSLSPLTRLKRLFDAFLSYFDEHGGKLGCPIGNLTAELGDTDDDFRLKLQQTFDGMRESVGAFLREAREQGELAPSLELDEAAEFVVSSWEGALVVMKAQASTAPLVTFDRVVFSWLRGDRVRE